MLSSAPLNQVVNQIRSAVLSMVDASRFEALLDRRPEIIVQRPGKPVLYIRYMGGDNEEGGLSSALSYRNLAFQIRIMHPVLRFSGMPQGTDALLYSQDVCLDAESHVLEKLYEDPSLGGLVLDSYPSGSIAGPISDEQGDEWYAHEITLVVRVH